MRLIVVCLFMAVLVGGVPAASAQSLDPSTQERQQYAFLTLLSLGGFIILTIGGAIYFYMVALKLKKPAPVAVPEVLTAPPNDLPPAMAGALVDGKIEARHFFAMLVDLARRGYLRMIEGRERGIKTLSFAVTEKDRVDLRGYEREFVRMMFGYATRLTMPDLRAALKAHAKIAKLDLELVMEQNGLIARARQRGVHAWKRRTQWIAVLALGWGMVGCGAQGGVTEAQQSLALSIWVGGLAAWVVFWLEHMLLGSEISAQTARGAQQVALWSAFRRYLERAARYVETLNADPAQFERYLPYAIAFGVDQAWIRHFSAVEGVPAPDWYLMGGFTASPDASTTPDGGMDSSADSGAASFSLEGASEGMSAGLESVSAGFSLSLESISDGLADMLNDAASALDSGFDSGGDGDGDSDGGDSDSDGGGDSD